MFLVIDLPHGNRDGISFPAEFERVGQQVIQNLSNPEGVPIDLFFSQIDGDLKLLFLLLGLRTEYLRTARNTGAQIEAVPVQRHSALLHPGQFQNIIDQS